MGSRTRLKLALAALAVVGASGGLLGLELAGDGWRRGEGAAARGEGQALLRRGYRLAAGDELEYELRLASTVDVRMNFLAKPGEPAATQRLSLDLDGKASLRIDDVSGATVTAHFAFDGAAKLGMDGRDLVARQDSDVLRELREGVGVDLARDGAVLAIRAPFSPESPAYGAIAHVLGAIQVSVPAGNGDRWTRTEEDPVGRYEASYMAFAERGDRLQIHKKKAYRALGAEDLDAAAKTAIVARFDDRAGHVALVEGDAELVLRRGAAEIYRGRTEVRLALVRRTSGVARARASGGAVLAASSRPWEEPAEGAPPDSRPLFESLTPDRRASDRRLVAGASAVALVSAVPDVLRGDPKARGKLARRLGALVRLDPGAADVIQAAILATPPGHEAEDVLIAGLAAAGTPEAEEALLAVGEARRSEPGTLDTLFSALSDMEAPSARAEAFMRDAYRDATLDPRSARAAIVALGALAAHVREADGARSLAVASELAVELEAGRLAPEVVLSALGNAGDVTAIDGVTSYLAPDRPESLRAKAAFALRNVAGDRAEAILASLLVDRSLEVRRAAARSLNARPLAPASIASLVVALRSDPDARMRRDALRTLAGYASDAAVRSEIERASRVDPSEDVRHAASQILGITCASAGGAR